MSATAKPSHGKPEGPAGQGDADWTEAGQAGGSDQVRPGRPVDRLMSVLEAFRELDPDMPIQYALSFLTLARHPGLSIRELSERLGIAQSSASRNVAALSAWHSFRKPGHGLVEAKEDPRERRRKIVSLTPKGKALMRRLDQEMDGRKASDQSVTRFAGTGDERALKAKNA